MPGQTGRAEVVHLPGDPLEVRVDAKLLVDLKLQLNDGSLAYVRVREEVIF